MLSTLILLHILFYLCTTLFKLGFSEKATKIWCNLPQGLDNTKEHPNLEEDCAKLLMPSQYKLSLQIALLQILLGRGSHIHFSLQLKLAKK